MPYNFVFVLVSTLKEPSWCAFVELKLLVSSTELVQLEELFLGMSYGPAGGLSLQDDEHLGHG